MPAVTIYTPKNDSSMRRIGLGGAPLNGAGGTVVKSYAQTSEIIANPERGFFQYTETHYQADGSGHTALSAATMTSSRTGSQQTLVFRYYVIEKYLTQDTIDQAYLDLLTADFAAARQAGVKMVIRFSYSNSGDMTPPYGADPSPSRVLSHISQLAPALNAYADVIDSVEAGFIGMWGEWYYTDNFGDVGTLTAQNWADREAVVNALLDNLDQRIFVLVRYVGVKHRLFGDTVSARSNRVGFHNDAFLAPYDDYGTYTTFTSLDVASTRAYLQNQQNVPIGGESAVGNPPHSDWPSANNELAQYHWTFLNPLYHMDVLNSWGQSGRDEAARRLGYRLQLMSGTFGSSCTASTQYAIKLTIRNTGYASPYRDRPVNVVFHNADRTVSRTLTSNVKNWDPGNDIIIDETVLAPDQPGVYDLSLHIPDASMEIAPDPAYAIRFANSGVWDASTGYNNLNHQVTVS